MSKSSQSLSGSISFNCFNNRFLTLIYVCLSLFSKFQFDVDRHHTRDALLTSTTARRITADLHACLSICVCEYPTIS